jgi:hypothetical protein
MGYVLSLEEYYSQASSMILSGAAFEVCSSLSGEHKTSVKVLNGPVDIYTLAPGYYMRFIDLGEGRFHLYGFEVHSPSDIWVHENIPEIKFKGHQDGLYYSQLQALYSAGRVKFHKAASIGGGLELHGSLAKQYAKQGWIEKPAALKHPASPSVETRAPRAESMPTSPHGIDSNLASGKTLSSKPPAVSVVETPIGKVPPSVVSVPESPSSPIEAEKRVDEETRRISEKIKSMLLKLQKKINQEENPAIKESAQGVYNQLNQVYTQFETNKINKKKLQTDMKGIVLDALPQFDKAPTWKAFFLNILCSIANLFLAEKNQYRLIRPQSFEGLNTAKGELDALENQENHGASPSNQ